MTGGSPRNQASTAGTIQHPEGVCVIRSILSGQNLDGLKVTPSDFLDCAVRARATDLSLIHDDVKAPSGGSFRWVPSDLAVSAML